jgi:hypothetical protein
MAMYGTLTTYDLLETRFQYANEKIADLDPQALGVAVQQYLDAHNGIMREVVGDLAQFTTARDGMYGTGDAGTMDEVDEMGTAPPQKVAVGSVVGYPLRRFERAWQGSKKWLARATVGELMVQLNGMRTADRINIVRQVKRAFFLPVNYTWEDTLVDHRTNPPIAVKALANADSMPIPPGPNGEYHDPATHTHYLATATLTAGDVVALKETVLEHYAAGNFVIKIARAQEATIRGMTSNFVATQPVGVTGPTTDASLVGTLPMVPLGNRRIGEFDGVPVDVSPWVPSGYLVCYIRGVASVLRFRTEANVAAAGDLQLDAEETIHPLRADTYSREFGVGVHERTGAAVLFTGGGTYVAPAI